MLGFIKYGGVIAAFVTGTALGMYLWLESQDHTGPSPRVEAARSLGETLVAADEAPYLRDHARRIYGRVVDQRGKPVAGARVEFVDAIAYAEEVLTPDVPAGPEGRTTSGPDGTFLWKDPKLGHKLAFVFAEGRAPVRIDAVLVQDGVGSALGNIETPAASTCALNIPTGVKVRPLYAGFWPLTEWIRGETTIERREPDGWPMAFAVQSREGAVKILAAPKRMPRSECSISLVELAPWTPPKGPIPGPPALVSDTALAAAFALGIAEMQAPVAGEGRIVVQADRAFSAIELRLSTGEVFQQYSDAFAESVFDSVPSGTHLMRAQTFKGRWTRAKGVYVPPVGHVAIRFSRADERPKGVTSEMVIAGFVTRNGKPVDGARVFAQSRPPRPRSVTTNEHGFFQFTNLKPGRWYELVYGTDALDYMRNARNIGINGKQPDLPHLFHLELSGHRVTVELPDVGPSASISLVNRHDITIWRLPLEGRQRLVLNDVPSGLYTVRVDDGKIRLSSEPFELNEDNRTVAIDSLTRR